MMYVLLSLGRLSKNGLMSRYDTKDDPHCYLGTQVIKNKADLTEQDELEQLMFLTRSEEPLPDGGLDYEHYSDTRPAQRFKKHRGTGNQHLLGEQTLVPPNRCF